MTKADWIAADMGGAWPLAWAMSASGEVLDSAGAGAGARVPGEVAVSGPQVAASTQDRRLCAPIGEAHAASGAAPAGQGVAALMALIGPWLAAEERLPIVVCGLAGASGARPVPCTPLAGGAAAAPLLGVAGTGAGRSRAPVFHIVPGLCQARPFGLTRGEETRIAGVLASRPGFDGVLCLAGRESCWARISAGEVVSFQCFVSGALLDVLAGQARVGQAACDADAYADAVSEMLSHPERLAARLAETLCEAQMAGLAPDMARARLAGALTGAELAAARPYWLGEEVVVIGEAPHAALLRDALAAQGLTPVVMSGEQMVLAGLAAAHRALIGED